MKLLSEYLENMQLSARKQNCGQTENCLPDSSLDNYVVRIGQDSALSSLQLQSKPKDNEGKLANIHWAAAINTIAAVQ